MTGATVHELRPLREVLKTLAAPIVRDHPLLAKLPPRAKSLFAAKMLNEVLGETIKRYNAGFSDNAQNRNRLTEMWVSRVLPETIEVFCDSFRK